MASDLYADSFVARFVMTSVSNSNEDILKNNEDNPDEFESLFSIIQLCDYSLTSVPESQDGLCKEQAVPYNISAIKFFDNGTKMLAFFNDHNSEETYALVIPTDTETLEFTSFQKIRSSDSSYVIENDSFQIVETEELDFVYLVLSQSLYNEVSENTMKSFLVKFQIDNSGSLSLIKSTQMHENSVFAPNTDYLEDFKTANDNMKAQPIIMFSGLQKFHRDLQIKSVQICPDENSVPIAYWASFVDISLSQNSDPSFVTEFKQTSCLYVGCTTQVATDSPYMKICFHESDEYDYLALLLGQEAKFKRRPVEIFDDLIISVSDETKTKVRADICKTQLDTIASAVSIQECTIYECDPTGTPSSLYKVGKLQSNEAQDQLFLTVTDVSMTTNHAVYLLEFSSEFSSFKRRIDILNSKPFAIEQPTPFLMRGIEPVIYYAYVSNQFETQYTIHSADLENYKFQTTFAQSWFGITKNSVFNQCQNFFNYYDNEIEGGLQKIETLSDNSKDYSLYMQENDNQNVFPPKTITQISVVNQIQIDPYPWNECETPLIDKVLVTQLYPFGDLQADYVPINLDEFSLKDPCNFRRASIVSSGFYQVNEGGIDYLLVPLSQFLGQTSHTFDFQLLFENFQIVTQTVEVILVPEGACGSSYSEFTYPQVIDQTELTQPFHLTISQGLTVQFSFRPAIFKSISNPYCENTWKIESIHNTGNGGRVSQIFETFDFVIDKDSTEFQHILVKVLATVDREQAIKDRDLFPLDLVLEFSFQQQNDDMIERFTEKVTVTLDLECIFDLEIMTLYDNDFNNTVNVINDQTAKFKTLQSIKLPNFLLNKPQCPSLKFSIKKSLKVDGNFISTVNTPWLIKTDCCIQLNLDLYRSFRQNNESAIMCHIIELQASIETLPGLISSSQVTDFQLCITTLSAGGPKLKNQIPIFHEFYENEDFTIPLPEVTSELQLTATLKVNDEFVPLGGCQSCPIYLQKISENLYQVKGLLGSKSGVLRRQLSDEDAQEELQIKTLIYNLLIEFQDIQGRKVIQQLILKSKGKAQSQINDIPNNTINKAGQEFNEEIPLIQYLKEDFENQSKNLTDPFKSYIIPTIESFSNRGLLKISFNHEIIVPDKRQLIALKDLGLIQLQIFPNEDSMAQLQKDDYSYSWQFGKVQSTEINIIISFDYPNKVCVYQDRDLILLTFRQSQEYLVPLEPLIHETIPDGYMIHFNAQPQLSIDNTNDFFQDVQKISQVVDTVVLSSVASTGFSNAFLQFSSGYGLQILWCLINGLQLVVHLPLYNVTLPANTQEMYENINSIVSFDYFEQILPTYARDIGITETPPWNQRFESLGYEENNIIANMGSILLFLAFIIFKFMVFIIFGLCGCICFTNCSSSKKRKHTKRKKNKRNYCYSYLEKQMVHLWLVHQINVNLALRFMLETIIEIQLCVVIGMGFQNAVTETQGESMTVIDKVSSGVMYILIGLICIFIFIVIEFTHVKSKILHKQVYEQKKLRYQIFIDDKLRNYQSIKNEQDLQKQRDIYITYISTIKRSQITYKSAAQIKKQTAVQKSMFGFYEVLYSGLKLENPGARFFHLLFVVRRGIFVAMIFVAHDHVWLQLLIFNLACLLQACYLANSLPLDSKLSNYIEIFNELALIWIGYQFLGLIGLVYMPHQINFIGNILIVTVMIMIVVNASAMTYQTVLGIYLTCRSNYRFRKSHKLVKRGYTYNETNWKNQSIKSTRVSKREQSRKIAAEQQEDSLEQTIVLTTFSDDEEQVKVKQKIDILKIQKRSQFPETIQEEVSQLELSQSCLEDQSQKMSDSDDFDVLAEPQSNFHDQDDNSSNSKNSDFSQCDYSSNSNEYSKQMDDCSKPVEKVVQAGSKYNTFQLDVEEIVTQLATQRNEEKEDSYQTDVASCVIPLPGQLQKVQNPIQQEDRSGTRQLSNFDGDTLQNMNQDKEAEDDEEEEKKIMDLGVRINFLMNQEKEVSKKNEMNEDPESELDNRNFLRAPKSAMSQQNLDNCSHDASPSHRDLSQRRQFEYSTGVPQEIQSKTNTLQIKPNHPMLLKSQNLRRYFDPDRNLTSKQIEVLKEPEFRIPSLNMPKIHLDPYFPTCGTKSKSFSSMMIQNNREDAENLQLPMRRESRSFSQRKEQIQRLNEIQHKYQGSQSQSKLLDENTFDSMSHRSNPNRNSKPLLRQKIHDSLKSSQSRGSCQSRASCQPQLSNRSNVLCQTAKIIVKPWVP